MLGGVIAARFLMKGVYMRATKDQMVNGIAAYIESEVIPQIGDKATQIAAAIAVKAVKANARLMDSVFSNPMLKNLLQEKDGTFEIDDLFEYIRESVDQFGPFPVTLPAIPLISPDEKTISFNADDIQRIKKNVERCL